MTRMITRITNGCSSALAMFFIILTTACQPAAPKNSTPTLKIAAAASTQPVLQALEAAYQQQHSVVFENYVQASGKLTAQIEQGAAIDLFLSADEGYPNYLHAQGRTAQPPVVYARGSLVLWTPDTALVLPTAMALLRLKPEQRLVIADPKAAPYGRLAQQVLEEAKLVPLLRPQIVYGQNIEQVNLYLYNKVADYALTACASLHHSSLKNYGQFVPIPDYQLPQAVALIQPLEGAVSAEAKEFYNYLQSAAAQSIFVEYGYLLP